MATAAELRLRRMVGDRYPVDAVVGSEDAKCFFSDAEITDILLTNNNDINAAALEGWLTKMAEFAKLIDQQRSGTTLKMSQMYKNAASMAEHYGELVGGASAALVGRVVGRAINLRERGTGGLIPYDTVGEVHTRTSAHRTELHNTEARKILQNSHPDTIDVDPSYPSGATT